MKSLGTVDARVNRRFLPFAGAFATVLLISLAAYTRHLPAFVAAHGIDKVLHATMAATLTFLLGRALRGRGILAGIIVFTGLGIDEYFQRYSSARSSDVYDLFADFVGIVIGIIVLVTLKNAPSNARERRAR